MPVFEIKREFDKHHSSLFVLHEYRYMAFNYRSLQTTRRDLVKRESIPWYLIQGMKGFWQVKLIFCCKLLWIFNTDITLAIWHYLDFFVGSSVIDSWPLTRAVQDTMQVPHTHDRPISQVVLNRELNQVITMCTESHIKVYSLRNLRGGTTVKHGYPKQAYNKFRLAEKSVSINPIILNENWILT